MIMNSQQVVSQNDAQVSLSGATSSVLGLLTVEHTFKHDGVEDLYTFHHLTFQELLAAFHIAGLEEQQQKDLLTTYSIYRNMRNVWKFYYGSIKTSSLKKNNEFLDDIIRTEGSLLDSDLIYKVQCAFESQLVELCDYVVSNGSLYFEDVHITHSDFTQHKTDTLFVGESLMMEA